MPDAGGIGFTVADTIESVALKRLRVLGLKEFLEANFPPRETLLSPWLPQKGLAMIYGPRGIGKTHLTLGIAYAVASGGMFLRWKAKEPRRVMVIDGEMPAVTLQERLAQVSSDATAPPNPDYLRTLAIDLQEAPINLGNEIDQRAIEPYLAAVDLIIVDNISTLVSTGRENEAESWLPVQQWTLEQRRAGRSVLFIHHAGKGGAQRGTSRREDVMDTVIALRKPEDYQPDQGARFEVHFEKNRGFHGEDAKPFEAALSASGWTMRDLADAEMEQVVLLTGNGLSIRDIAEVTKISKSTVARLQAKAREAGLLEGASHA